MLDLKALEARFVGEVFDTRTFVLDPDAEVEGEVLDKVRPISSHGMYDEWCATPIGSHSA